MGEGGKSTALGVRQSNLGLTRGRLCDPVSRLSSPEPYSLMASTPLHAVSGRTDKTAPGSVLYRA